MLEKLPRLKLKSVSLAVLISLVAVASASHAGVDMMRGGVASGRHVGVGGGSEDDNASTLASTKAVPSRPSVSDEEGKIPSPKAVTSRVVPLHCSFPRQTLRDSPCPLLIAL